MRDTDAERNMRILLVEDSPADVRLLREALKDASITVRMTTVRDGVEAMEYLHGTLRGQDPRPDLILLDLNLPRKSGREVLAEIKTDTGLRAIPVIIMSSSNADEDVEFAYSYSANSFITKPADLPEYMRIVRSIESFWLLSARLPDGLATRFVSQEICA